MVDSELHSGFFSFHKGYLTETLERDEFQTCSVSKNKISEMAFSSLYPVMKGAIYEWSKVSSQNKWSVTVPIKHYAPAISQISP